LCAEDGKTTPKDFCQIITEFAENLLAEDVQNNKVRECRDEMTLFCQIMLSSSGRQLAISAPDA
jgi:hypothetical protein